MVLCDRCNKDEVLPFRCNYCSGYYCSKHRLPEFHECIGIYQQRPVANWSRGSAEPDTDYVFPGTRNRSGMRNLFRFSEKEMQHLSISLFIVAAIPLMSFWGIISQLPFIGVMAIMIFTMAFLLHELAHKFMAQRLGFWAEYRLNTIGLMITLFSFFSPFKLLAPGAVMIAGQMYGNDYGKISLSGPLTNIAQAAVYIMFMWANPNESVVYQLARLGVIINSNLALFNLLPFGVFDGIKIIRWDWRAWLVTATTAAILFFYVQ
ncbi:MAG: AN1-type zinc finger domain-containing protein [Candidatus Bathyarchaeota archaeon]|jgi:Zn-dependent protease|nr:AN1-type zinc finger domain-containing protein [Candidatus Bathyarchaeota archaeon]